MLTFNTSDAGIFISQQSGNWFDNNTWEFDSTTYPAPRDITNGDTVIIKAGDTVTIFNNGSDYGSGAQPILYVQVEGVLTFKTGRKLIMPCGSGVKVLGGSIIVPGGGGGSSNVIDICNTVLWRAGDGSLPGPVDLGTTPTYPLPVSWVNVEVKQLENSHHILWTTAEEEDESHFEILRSSDLINWNKLGQVESKGNGEYSFIDKDYSKGFSYYQVRFVEISGNSSLSKIVSVFKDSESDQINIMVYPNPSSDFVFIEGIDLLTATTQVTSANGNIIAYPQIIEQNKIKLDLQALVPGIYHLKVSNNSSFEVLRIVKI